MGFLKEVMQNIAASCYTYKGKLEYLYTLNWKGEPGHNPECKTMGDSSPLMSMPFLKALNIIYKAADNIAVVGATHERSDKEEEQECVELSTRAKDHDRRSRRP